MVVRTSRRWFATALSGAFHLVVLALLVRERGPTPADVAQPSPSFQVVLTSRTVPTSSVVRSSGRTRRAAPLIPQRFQVSGAASTAVTGSVGQDPKPSAAVAQDNRLGASLRKSLIGCQMMGAVLVDHSMRERCSDRFGARLRDAPAINSIPAAKRASYDDVAYQQEEDRAFFHVPTIGHLYPQGAGGIAGGPASTEIFSHNVGDPTPPRDPLLKRQSKSLGPPAPDR